jgi:hypothetical protein
MKHRATMRKYRCRSLRLHQFRGQVPRSLGGGGSRIRIIGMILTILWVVGFMNGYMVATGLHFLLVLATVFISRSFSRFQGAV